MVAVKQCEISVAVKQLMQKCVIWYMFYHIYCISVDEIVYYSNENQTTASKLYVLDVQETVDLIKQGQYQIACTKYFELTHGMPPERFINHPNQYFEESQNIKNGKADSSKRVSITTSK